MATTPMFDPNGNIKDVANDQVDAAKGAGGQVAYNLLSPSGDSKWVHETDLPAAVAHGGLPANMSEANRIQAKLPQRSTSPDDSFMEDKLETLQNTGLVSSLQAGFIRSAARAYGNYSDGLFGLLKKIPGADKVLDMSGSDPFMRGTKYMGNTPVETGATSWLGRRAADLGDTTAGMYQFLTGNEMTKFLGAAFAGLSYVQKVKKLTPFMEELDQMPRLKGALLSAMSGGTTAGGISLAQNENWKPALANAVLTGSAAGLLDLVMPGQGTVKAPTEEEAAAGRQSAAQFTVKDTVQNAARQSLNKLNATRQPGAVSVIPPASRQLTASANPEPFTFDIETDTPRPQVTPPEPGAEGPAGRGRFERVPGKMALTPDVSEDSTGKFVTAPVSLDKLGTYTGSAEEGAAPFVDIGAGEGSPVKARFSRADPTKLYVVDGHGEVNAARLRGDPQIPVTLPKNEYLQAGRPSYQAKEPPQPPSPFFQYLTGAKPMGAPLQPGAEGPATPAEQPIEAGLTGPGVIRVKTPQDAQLNLDRTNDFINTPEFAKMSPEDQTHITGQRDALQQRLDLFNSFRNQPGAYPQPNFGPADVDALVAKMSTPGEAAGQLRFAVQPVYDHLDEVSGGEFAELRRSEQNAIELLRNRTLTAGEETAERSRLQNARDGMMRIFQENQATINPQEWKAANAATRDAFLFDDIHTATERATNYIAPQDVKPGRPRLLKPNFSTEFSKLLNKGNNRVDITRLLGPDGVDNMLDVGGMLDDPKYQQPAVDLATEMALNTLKLAGPKGYAARWVLRQMMSKPAAGKMFTYALRNGIPARTAAPLISTAVRGLTQQKPEEQETEPTQ